MSPDEVNCLQSNLEQIKKNAPGVHIFLFCLCVQNGRPWSWDSNRVLQFVWHKTKKWVLTKSMWCQHSLLIIQMLVIVMAHLTARVASKTWVDAPLRPLSIQTVASTKGRSQGWFAKSQVLYVRVGDLFPSLVSVTLYSYSISFLKYS